MFMKIVSMQLLLAVIVMLSNCVENPTNSDNVRVDTVYVLRANDTGLIYNYPNQRDLVVLALKTTLVSTDSVAAHYKIEGTVLNNRDTLVDLLSIQLDHYSRDSILVYSCDMVVGSYIFGVKSKSKAYFSTDEYRPYSYPTGPSVYQKGYSYTSRFLDIKIADTSKMNQGYTEITFKKG